MAGHEGHAHAGTTSSIRTAFILNLVFTVIEIAGGLWTNSVAILSDAIHDLGDSFSLGLAWLLDRYAQKDRDARFSYGYRRFSLLGALINTVVLLVGSVIVLSKAVPRLFNPQQSNAQGMALLAVAGIAVNGWAVLRLRGSRSMNARVIVWHLLEDVLGWVAVLVVAIILLFADIKILDPILSILITAYVLFNVIRNLRETLTLFLQGVPADIDLDAIEQEIIQIEDVRGIHHTHIWSLDGEHHVLTAHVVVDEATASEDVILLKREIRDSLRRYEFSHLTVEVEYGLADCALDDDPQETGPARKETN
jgi:cobalt-zinc-cadmium efflux system protein